MPDPKDRQPMQPLTPDPLAADDAPPTAEEAAAAARLAHTLDALGRGRAGLDDLPPASDDDLHALAALGALLRAAEGGGDLRPDRHDAVWERIAQRTQGRPLATPARPMTWWRWLWVALPSAAAVALVLLWGGSPTSPVTSHAPTSPAQASSAAAPRAAVALDARGLPASVAALDADAPREAARLQARQASQAPEPSGDTALRDLRRARLDAWRADVAAAHRVAPSPAAPSPAAPSPAAPSHPLTPAPTEAP